MGHGRFQVDGARGCYVVFVQRIKNERVGVGGLRFPIRDLTANADRCDGTKRSYSVLGDGRTVTI